MGSIQVDISPPSYWQDFERLTLDLVKIKWKDDYAQRHGRQGQAQAGVDIYGVNKLSDSEYTGIQCKKRKNSFLPKDVPSGTLTTEEIDKEITKAKKFKPQLKRFIIATTGPRDAVLQEYVRKIPQKTSKFKISLMFWDDYVDFLNDHPDLMYRYYENVLKYRNKYDPQEHYLRLLAMAFDRPALKTPFHCESRVTDFIHAISSTQDAIATGRLQDREGRIIDQVPIPDPKPKELIKVAKILQQVRNIATNGLNSRQIKEYSQCLEILDPNITLQLNDLRRNAIDLLNKILSSLRIEEITFDRY